VSGTLFKNYHTQERRGDEMRREVLFFVVVGFILALVNTTNATVIWGVTGTSNMNSANALSEVFTVDTQTWTATKLDTTTLDGSNRGRNYSDIAVTQGGSVYCIGSDYKGGGSYFKDFFRLNPATGQVLQAWRGINPRNVEMNALVALNDTTLYAIEGGLSSQNNPHLIRINLNALGNYSSAVDVGQIDGTTGYSGGDVVLLLSGQNLAAASLGGGDDIYKIDLTNPATASKIVTATKANIAGLAWDYDALGGPKLLGGIFTDNAKWLYNLNLGTGSMTQVYSLNPTLSWDIFGLASVPEPATVCLLGLGTLVLLRRKR
jgi:hypothetical protein